MRDAECRGVHSEQFCRALFAGDFPLGGVERVEDISAFKLLQFLRRPDLAGRGGGFFRRRHVNR